MRIEKADFSDPSVLALIQFHFETLQGESPPEACHVFDVTKLQKPSMTLFCAHIDQMAVSMGGLDLLNSNQGEIKSMRTLPDFLRRGLAQAILTRIIDEARNLGLSELLLETGTTDYFAPATRLYLANGFESCGRFGAYEEHPATAFMHKLL